ncbi:unnamed protein product, partial [Mesorhabditis spiculigera]
MSYIFLLRTSEWFWWLNNLICRSRRGKDQKETPVTRRGASVSHTAQTKVVPPEQNLCVCDSIDDQMIERFSQIPGGVDTNEWLATHTLALFDHVNALCGSISELCTPVTCPAMSFPGTSKAIFVDERGKRHTYTAPQYIDCVMSFCEQNSKNEDFFPTRYGSTFSGDFQGHCRRVIRLLWQCCGHLYTNHWDQMGVLDLRPQCAMVLAHMSQISKIFGLLEPKDQQLVNNTVQLIRPAYVPVMPLSTRSPSTLPLGAEPPRYSRVPSSKSGSWGGHPTTQVLSAKPYAQTC